MSLDLVLTGKSQEHLTPLENESFSIHQEALADFLKLRKNASEAGFNLQILSSFRDYERQKIIWNEKAQGKRLLLDTMGNPLNFKDLSQEGVVFSILRWSALPGASRHHWGTDLDVYDGNAVPPNYSVQLIPAEVEPGGIFGKLHQWLDTQIAEKKSFGFFRPYDQDLGGVAPEKWHLSYAPIAQKYFDLYDFGFFQKMLQESKIELLEVVWDKRKIIFENFIKNISI